MTKEIPKPEKKKLTRSSEATNNVPLSVRSAHEIPKPKDPEAFQRNCVALFQAELNDPNATEYGRRGQKQRGIDILAKRNGDPEHFVGVQCKRYVRPLKEEEIEKECRDALTLDVQLKEIILATTSPDDAPATDAACRIEKKLRDEGHDITVTLLGWGAMESLIIRHDVAYNLFMPSAAASYQPTSISPDDAKIIASLVAAELQPRKLYSSVSETNGGDDEKPWAHEDAALHGKIDAYRDLHRDHETLTAEKGLLKLFNEEDLSEKPWAQYRLLTNLASVSLELGREEEAAERFEAAYEIKPEHSLAVTNLALARTLRGELGEAMKIAQEALGMTPKCEAAITYLLQAAGKSDWEGEPESLIPEAERGSIHADLGLADFIRRRKADGWEQKVIDIAEKHTGQEEFDQMYAVAVLSLVIEDGQQPKNNFDVEQLNIAADKIKALATRQIEQGFSDKHDLLASVNNACVLLRLCERHPECADLAQKALPQLGDEAQIRRLLALSLNQQGLNSEALDVIRDDSDSENQLIEAELIARKNPERGLVKAQEIKPEGLNEANQVIRLRIIAELALRLGELDQAKDAKEALAKLTPEDIYQKLIDLSIRELEATGDEKDKIISELVQLSETLEENDSIFVRSMLADELCDRDLHTEAAAVLRGFVDLSRPSPSLRLFVRCLASARQDKEFNETVDNLPKAVRDDPDILWTTAAHAWNTGDLTRSLERTERLLELEPNSGSAKLMQVEIFLRRDDTQAILDELKEPLEELPLGNLSKKIRIARLLARFGFSERAAAHAYRLLLENRDKAEAWMGLSSVILAEGRWSGEKAELWDMPEVQINAAVEFCTLDEEGNRSKTTLVNIEPDSHLRNLDENSWEPEHKLAQLFLGHKAGDVLEADDGQKFVIVSVRHKYVARLHDIMNNSETRFPGGAVFKKVEVDTEKPTQTPALVEQLSKQHEASEVERQAYLAGRVPLALYAAKLGADALDVATAHEAEGHPLKVAIGNGEERDAAHQAITENDGAGCVLDLWTFWNAWRLELLDVVTATCGKIHVTQSLLDRLREKREELEFHIKDGRLTSSLVNGEVRTCFVEPEMIQKWRDGIDKAIQWLTENTRVLPVVFDEKIPITITSYSNVTGLDTFDALVAAQNEGILLVSDDLGLREYGRESGFAKSAWLNAVMRKALDNGSLDAKTFIQTTANQIEGSYTYISVTNGMLMLSLQMDVETTGKPDRLFENMIKMLGGRGADPHSHVGVVSMFLEELWANEKLKDARYMATSKILRRVIANRINDHKEIILAIARMTRDDRDLLSYIGQWVRGHFIVLT
ncbi:MAG: tetratricopeptide repeat protein [Filomicrobium sp.]